MIPLGLTNPDPFQYSWWLASRAAGITALLFVTLSTILGLVMASGIIKKRGLKAKLMPAHEYLALFSVLMIVVHGVTLLGDKWLKATVAGIAVPGVIGYRPFWVAIGIIAGYITIALALSFYARKLIGIKRWRLMHRFIVVVWIMGVVHSLGAGTDAGTIWLRALILASVAPALFLTLYRWLPENNRERDMSTPGTHGETLVVHPHGGRPARAGTESQVTIPAPEANPNGSTLVDRPRPTIPAPRERDSRGARRR